MGHGEKLIEFMDLLHGDPSVSCMPPSAIKPTPPCVQLTLTIDHPTPVQVQPHVRHGIQPAALVQLQQQIPMAGEYATRLFLVSVRESEYRSIRTLQAVYVRLLRSLHLADEAHSAKHPERIPSCFLLFLIFLAPLSFAIDQVDFTHQASPVLLLCFCQPANQSHHPNLTTSISKYTDTPGRGLIS